MCTCTLYSEHSKFWLEKGHSDLKTWNSDFICLICKLTDAISIESGFLQFVHDSGTGVYELLHYTQIAWNWNNTFITQVR